MGHEENIKSLGFFFFFCPFSPKSPLYHTQIHGLYECLCNLIAALLLFHLALSTWHPSHPISLCTFLVVFHLVSILLLCYSTPLFFFFLLFFFLFFALVQRKSHFALAINEISPLSLINPTKYKVKTVPKKKKKK
jgi:hypothetical protein